MAILRRSESDSPDVGRRAPPRAPSIFPRAWSRRHHGCFCGAAPNDDRQSGGVERKLRAMKRERRLGPFVAVDGFVAETVAAASGREVVERPVEPVASQ